MKRKKKLTTKEEWQRITHLREDYDAPAKRRKIKTIVIMLIILFFVIGLIFGFITIL
jgi:cell division septal protein FtsQ